MTLERWISPAFSNLRVYFSGDNPRDRWISPAFSHLRFSFKSTCCLSSVNKFGSGFVCDLSKVFGFVLNMLFVKEENLVCELSKSL
ncbi:hypothetical protein Hanom_Chr11g00997251 [Helianthus anomalus]